MPHGYGALVRRALSRPLKAHYNGDHGVAFAAKPQLFGIALSSYMTLPAGSNSPTDISIGFVVGTFSYRRARRELLTWAAMQKGATRFRSDWQLSKETGRRQPSPLIEMLPEISVLLEYEAENYVEIDYDLGA